MLTIDYHQCLACAGCISLCPEMALFMNRIGLGLQTERCTLCGICTTFCPVRALSIDGDGAV